MKAADCNNKKEIRHRCLLMCHFFRRGSYNYERVAIIQVSLGEYWFKVTTQINCFAERGAENVYS